MFFNFIPWLKVNGEWLYKKPKIKHGISSFFFQSVFENCQVRGANVDRGFLKCINSMEKDSLKVRRGGGYSFKDGRGQRVWA